MYRNAAWVAVILFAVQTATAEDTSYFRKHSGVAVSGTALPNNFETDAQLEWRAELPPGHSTPCVCGDAIYVTTFEADRKQLATVALDRETGKPRWRRECPAERLEPFHPTGSPASSTVACNGRQVFAFFGSYGLLAYDLDGNLLWSKPMGPFQDEFGASSSPVLADNLVLLNEDHDVDSFLIAIDQETGDTVWKIPRDGATRSYATPVIWNQGDTKQVVVAGALQLAGYDLKTGEMKWWVNGLSRIVDSTPLIAEGDLYVATWTPGGDSTDRIAMEPFDEALKNLDQNGDRKIAKSELPEGSPVIPRFFRMDLDQDETLNSEEWARHASVFERAQNAAIRIAPGGSGDVTETNVRWIYRRGLPTVPSSVVHNGALYMVKDSGIVTSVDIETGDLLKTGRLPQGRGNYYASLVAGDGKVYLCSERGVISVLAAQPEWDVLSSHDFQERITATPVIADGKFYLRTETALYCFSKK